MIQLTSMFSRAMDVVATTFDGTMTAAAAAALAAATASADAVLALIRLLYK